MSTGHPAVHEVQWIRISRPRLGHRCRKTSQQERVGLDKCDLSRPQVVHRTDDVDLLAGVALLNDRRRVPQSGHLPPHVLGGRVVEQIAGLRLLRDDHGRPDRGDEGGQSPGSTALVFSTLIAASTAPHPLWPSTMTSGTPKNSTPYSSDASRSGVTMLPATR